MSNWLVEFWRRIRFFINRRQFERDLDEEMRLHKELRQQEYRKAGIDPESARYQAQRQFGNDTLLKEVSREMWEWHSVEILLQDLRYGLRMLAKSPGFIAVAVLTLAIGIGANTSIFSVVHAVLLRPLPYKHAERLVSPVNVAKDNFMGLGVADFQYATWRDQTGIFDGIAAYAGRDFTITGSGEPEQLKAQAVTPGFLRVMGIAPMVGRDFIPRDAAPRGGQVALLSYPLWIRRFGGDSSILSRQLTLDGKPYSVAGVLPRDFAFPENTNVTLLVALSEPAEQPSGAIYFYSVIARMRQGVTAEHAEADLALINKRLEPAYSQRLGRTEAGAQTRLIGLHDRLVGNVRPALLVLAGAVGLVLLIVCVNVCNLLLARAIARQKEIAVRIALGAGRARVLRQLLTEGMLLAAGGGLAGLAFAFGGVKLLLAIAPAGVPHIDEAQISAAVLGFNLSIATCAGLVFGLAPARAASGIDPETALKQTVRSASSSRRQRRLENLLIVSETAFALVLLAGAGLLMRTFAGLTAIAPGFHPENVLTVRLSLPYWKYRTAERQRAFLDALMQRVRSGPGVDAVSAVACLPYGGFVLTGALEIEGRSTPGPDPHANNVAVNYAVGDYFRSMGIPIKEGRPINSFDQPGRPSVAVVNDALIHRFFPDGHALGSHIRIEGVTDWLQIVGVAGNVKQSGLASEPRAEIFQSAAQAESGSSAQTMAIRSTADLRILIPWLRSQIAELDKDLAPPEIETMRAKMASLMASQVFVMRLLALFAGIAITLAASGIYSVLVYSVERRSLEIGIRLALGAKRADIMGLILGRGLRLSLAGAAAGTIGALGLTRFLKTLLYGVTPHDPVTLAAGCILVVLVALSAAYVPARRAMKQEVIATLRAE
jgi:putative ABC transport system permease protein